MSLACWPSPSPCWHFSSSLLDPVLAPPRSAGQLSFSGVAHLLRYCLSQKSFRARLAPGTWLYSDWVQFDSGCYAAETGRYKSSDDSHSRYQTGGPVVKDSSLKQTYLGGDKTWTVGHSQDHCSKTGRSFDLKRNKEKRFTVVVTCQYWRWDATSKHCFPFSGNSEIVGYFLPLIWLILE